MNRHEPPTDGTRFPGERRTTTGRFSGGDGRLLSIGVAGSLREFSYPLLGRTGIVRSRFGVTAPESGGLSWFESSRSTQRYVAHTGLVETTHDTDHGTVVQSDFTTDDRHLTHFDLRDAPGVELVFAIEFAPDGREDRLAQLHHGDAIEVYHADEADYLASATGFVFRGGTNECFENGTHDQLDGIENGHDETALTGTVVGAAPVVDGSVTLGSLLTSRADTDRKTALAALRDAVTAVDASSLRERAMSHAIKSVDRSVPYATAITTDLLVLASLTGESGLRVAGPEFDPHYAYSGGYGYAWFRDDAEISRFLLGAHRHFDLGLGECFERSANAYAAAQLQDGTWPHRVWAFDGSLAPGWANGRLEAGDGRNYQADQTASVLTFLAEYDDNTHRERANDRTGYADVIERGLSGLDASLAPDDRPVVCQNAWEDTTGRFTHTAATFLEAYATVAATRTDDVGAHAAERAHAIYDAIHDLWVPERGSYALREYGPEHPNTGDLDTRFDSATLALVSAHRAYARVGTLDTTRLDCLVSHVERVIEGLSRETDAIRGLVRYEGDEWRRHDQPREKVWTVSTAWGANAAGVLSAMLAARDDDRSRRFGATARDLLEPLLPDGSLCLDSGYLPEQMFDDGTPDSATPLGWSHALRTATIAELDRHGLLEVPPEVS